MGFNPVDLAFGNMDALRASNERLRAENAKLRELVKRAFACIQKGEDEYGTDWSCIGCEFSDVCDGWFQMADQARELGVEVD